LAFIKQNLPNFIGFCAILFFDKSDLLWCIGNSRLRRPWYFTASNATF